MGRETNKLVQVGRISGLYGVHGWVRIFSYTEPRENIIQYRPWHLQGPAGLQAIEVVVGRRHGKSVIARLAGCDDRDCAAKMVGLDIAVYRDQLPATESGEYYWADLIGLVVRTTKGIELGNVDHLIATGANDVLIVKGDREHLIPFVKGAVIHDVDLDQGFIEVDWDPEF